MGPITAFVLSTRNKSRNRADAVSQRDFGLDPNPFVPALPPLALNNPGTANQRTRAFARVNADPLPKATDFPKTLAGQAAKRIAGGRSFFKRTIQQKSVGNENVGNESVGNEKSIFKRRETKQQRRSKFGQATNILFGESKIKAEIAKRKLGGSIT